MTTSMGARRQVVLGLWQPPGIAGISDHEDKHIEFKVLVLANT